MQYCSIRFQTENANEKFTYGENNAVFQALNITRQKLIYKQRREQILLLLITSYLLDIGIASFYKNETILKNRLKTG